MYYNSDSISGVDRSANGLLLKQFYPKKSCKVGKARWKWRERKSIFLQCVKSSNMTCAVLIESQSFMRANIFNAFNRHEQKSIHPTASIYSPAAPVAIRTTTSTPNAPGLFCVLDCRSRSPSAATTSGCQPVQPAMERSAITAPNKATRGTKCPVRELWL